MDWESEAFFEEKNASDFGIQLSNKPLSIEADEVSPRDLFKLAGRLLATVGC